jgi:hypothetical protein
MKTGLLLLAVAGGCGITGSVPAADTHVLFMGANLSLQQPDDPKGGPGYTPANDLHLKFAARSGAAGGAKAAADMAVTQAAQLAEEEWRAVLNDAFFKSALVQGKAVEGMARVRPADLTL